MKQRFFGPVSALILGLLGAALYFYYLATSFEAGTGLPILGAPGVCIFLLFSLLTALWFFFLSRKQGPLSPGGAAGEEILPPGILTLRVLGGLLLFFAGALGVYFGITLRVVGSTILGLMAAVGGYGCITLTSAQKKGLEKNRHFAAALTVFYVAIALIFFYRFYANDPILGHFCVAVFGLLFAASGLFFAMGQFFGRPAPKRAFFCCAMAFVLLISVYLGRGLYALLAHAPLENMPFCLMWFLQMAGLLCFLFSLLFSPKSADSRG